MAYGQTAKRDAFDALGDSTRRLIFERLAVRPAPVGVLAATLPISRPAVSQHLRVLKEAGLVSETADGARRIYQLDPRGIAVMRDWLDNHWATALGAFETFVNDTQRKDDPE
ncbi:MAG TPA: metalloregulator ArsR/SmtB family transcription factor [Caulobacteraceae bacterium]